MTVETTQAIAAGMSQATSGSETPDNLTVTRPTRESVWTIYGVLFVVWMVAVLVILIIGFMKWPETSAHDRIFTLGCIAYGAMVCIGILVIALASSRLGRVDASVGASRLEIDGTAGKNSG